LSYVGLESLSNGPSNVAPKFLQTVFGRRSLTVPGAATEVDSRQFMSTNVIFLVAVRDIPDESVAVRVTRWVTI
jgi:hypothetical protein